MVERDEIWRVYLPEWLIVLTSRSLGQVGWDECNTWYQEHYAGKVQAKDWRIVTQNLQRFTTEAVESDYNGRWVLQLRLNNLRCETSDKVLAGNVRALLGETAEVVAKFSRDERKLAEYGKRKLHGTRRPG
jgi:hypothetical protein